MFFFYLTDGDLIEEDDVGQELPDPMSALRESEWFASEIRSDVEHPGIVCTTHPSQASRRESGLMTPRLRAASKHPTHLSELLCWVFPNGRS